MAEAKMGDRVRVHFTARLLDGTIVSTTADEEPLEFTIGEGEIIPGLERAAIGMNPGESKTIQIPADQAFGPHHPEMVVVMDRRRFPAEWQLEVGRELQFRKEDGDVVRFFITNLSETEVTLDANHPLAGKDLSLDLKFIEIV